MDSAGSLKIGTVNLNSLMGKLKFVRDLINQERLFLLGVCETWLTASVATSFVSLDGFQVVRRDGAGDARKHGVCLYISNSVKYISVDVPCHNLVAVHLFDFDIYVVVAYRPPSYTEMENAELVSFLQNFCLGRETILMGDFNLPSLKWSEGDILDRYIPPVHRQFLECFTMLGMTQWVREGTFTLSGNILDLVLTSDQDRIGSVCVLSSLPNCFHCPVVFQYLFELKAETSDSHCEKYDWHRGNYASI